MINVKNQLSEWQQSLGQDQSPDPYDLPLRIRTEVKRWIRIRKKNLMQIPNTVHNIE